MAPETNPSRMNPFTHRVDGDVRDHLVADHRILDGVPAGDAQRIRQQLDGEPHRLHDEDHTFAADAGHGWVADHHHQGVPEPA